MMNKSTKILLNSTKTTLRTIADSVYIILFITLTVYGFLNTVQLNVDWEKLLIASEGLQRFFLEILLSPNNVLMAVVLIQYLCSQKYNWKEYIFAFCIWRLSSPVQTTEEGAVLFSHILLILGARHFSFRYLMKIYFAIVASLTALVVLASQIGVIENLVFEMREGRMAYGFVYATDCAAHFLFLALIYWYIRGQKIHYVETALFGILAAVAGFGCKARFSTALLVILIVVVVVYLFVEKRLGRERWNQMMSGKISEFLVLFPLLANLVIHIVSFVYTDRWKWLSMFDSLVSGRLSLAKKGLDIYGLDLWGNRIRMIGNGGRTQTAAGYFYIDSSYLQISMLHGVVLLGVFLFLLFLVCLNARRRKEWIVLTICGFVVIHGLFEHHAFELAYNPFLLMAFAEAGQMESKQISFVKKMLTCKAEKRRS